MAVSTNPSRRHAEVGFAAVLIAVAGWAYVTGLSYPDQSGAYPRVLAVLLGIGAIIMVARTLLRAPEVDEPRLLDHPGRFVLGFGMIFLYIVAIDLIGYIVPSIAFAVTVPVLLGYRNWKLMLPVVFGTIVFIYLVFVVMLERPLPPDILDPLLGVLK